MIGQYNYYKVSPDGKAPAGLSPGDAVITGGGSYVITGVNPDGSYNSALASKNVTTSNFTGQYTGAPAQAPDPADSTDSQEGESGELEALTSKLYKALSDSKIAALRSAMEASSGSLTSSYNTSIADLDTARYGLQSTYDGKRRQAAAASDVGAMNFAQYMASRGVKGAAGGLPELYRSAGLQNALSSLDTAEARDKAALDIKKAALSGSYKSSLAALENSYASDAAAAGADSEAASLEAQLALLREQADKTAAADTQAKDDWLATLGQYSADYQAQINAVTADGDPSNDWQLPYLKAARQEKLAAQADAAAKAGQQEYENWYRLQQLIAKGGLTGTPLGV